MAIFSLSTKPISRSGGRSAVAASAYRSGAELVDHRTGVVHDYTRRRGVVHTEIVTRDGVPVPERESLWNQAEVAEKRKDARVAREHLVALPHELDADQRLALARDFARELSDRYGVAVDLAVHAPDRDGDQRNHHAHLLATTRIYGHDGLGDKSSIELSDKKRKSLGMGRGADEVKTIRQRWQTLANAALERADVASRIDCRSLADQGSQRVPQIHVGSMGTDQIRRGTPEQSDRASLNLEIKAANAELHQLQQRAAQRAAEREAAAKAAQEKAEREAAAKAAQEKAEREAAARAAREKAEREAAAKAAQEKAEREAAARAAQEKAERERQEVARAQRQAARELELRKFELEREKERQEIESKRPLRDRVRDASVAVHEIDDEIKQLDDARESTSFFKFGMRRELQARIDELQNQRQAAYATYAELRDALEAEKAAESSGRDKLRAMAADIKKRRGESSEPRPEVKPEKATQAGQPQTAKPARKPFKPGPRGPGMG
ncbi:MobQ family relaxase (plasmid) [Halomonas sp. Bachu 37]|uniref:MobQ family relaxase n=1 Tax=Halomonas kashgarensis TaxID=3084920 RepID=UPI003216DE1C